MRALLVQSDIAWEDKRENYRRIADLLAHAAPRPGDLVLLPEMFDTGFSFNLAITADHDLATLNFLADLARTHRVTLQGSRTVIGPDGKGRNRASILGPDGGLLAEYDKVHPFSYGKESRWFTGGTEVITYPWIGDTDRLTVGPAICYDLRFPELFRLAMLRGAEVFALGANWPAPRALHRKALGIARAIENQAFMLCVNRSGADPNHTYAGGSFAVGPKGETLVEAGTDAGVIPVEIDSAALRAWRAEFPACRDTRLIRAHDGTTPNRPGQSTLREPDAARVEQGR